MARRTEGASTGFGRSVLISYAFGLVAGATMAIVLVDATVLIPLLILPLAGAPVVDLLRRVPTKAQGGLAAAAIAVGSAAVGFGHHATSDGTVAALGVLGGSALAEIGVVVVAWLGRERLRRHGEAPSVTPEG